MIIPFNCPHCGGTIKAETGGLKRRVVECTECGESVQVPENLAIGPGTVVGSGYRLERKIDDTSLGELFLASQENQGRFVGIEILSGETSRDQEKVTRLMQEIELVASMKHDHIVEAIEAGQDGDTYFLVTAYEAGETLEQKLRQGSAVAEKDALEYTAAIAAALDYAWREKKVLHRDIKPSTIYITKDNKAKLTGFGIAKSSEGQSLGLTGIGFTIGTPEYMSPEQIQAAEDLDFRADMYSLGIVLFEALTGGLPFQEKSPILLMNMHMDQAPDPVNSRNPSVSAGTTEIVAKMLAKSRDDRYPTWQALIDALKKAAAGAKSSKPAAAKSGTASAGSPAAALSADKKKLLLIGGAIAAAGLILLLLVVIVILLATR